MFYEKFFKSSYKWRMKIILGLFYSLMLIFIYTVSFFSSRQNAANQLNYDMHNRIDTALSSIKTDYEKKIVDIKYLAQNNTLTIPFVYSTTKAVKEVIKSEIDKHPGSYDHIIIMDNNKTVFYNSSGLSDKADAVTSDNTPGWYLFQGIPVYMHYEPVMIGKGKIGSIYVYYKLSDFYSIFSGQLGNDYRVFGFSGVKALLMLDRNGSYVFDKQISPTFSSNLKSTSLPSFKYNGVINKVYSTSISLCNQKDPLILSIGIEDSLFKKLQWKFIKSGLYLATFISVILTVILLLMYKAASYYLNKDYSNKLEMQSLHSQRHDFSKHLNIINGMAEYGDFEGLKEYVKQLSGKVVFTGSLLRLNCTPLSVLIQEKEIEIQRKGISFEFDSNTDFGGMHMSPIDLCMVTGNLLDNAIEAVENLPVPERRILLSLSHDENYHIVKVSNTGTLTEKVDIERIFEPGYSTKKDRKGRGMGLHIVKSILKKYHGLIQVENSNGMVSFTAYLPL